MTEPAYQHFLKVGATGHVRLTLKGRDPAGGADPVPVTDATVAVTFKDKDGTDLSGETWPVSLPHVAGGVYDAFTAHQASAGELGTDYFAHFVITSTEYGSRSPVIPFQFEADAG